MPPKLKTKSALPYFGSDSEVAGQLAAMLDHCKHVTIPFVGGGAILPHLAARSIVANDLNDFAITFYRCISGRFGEDAKQRLIAQCESTLSHPDELEAAKAIVKTSEPIAKAWAYWALCWIGRKGKGGTKHLGGLPSVRRTAVGGNNATRLAAASSDLSRWALELKRCEWESIDFRALIPKIADRADCGVYCDPPWFGVGRNYLHEFSQSDHEELAQSLRRFEHTTVVVRYGASEQLTWLYPKDDWTWITSDSRTQANKATNEVWLVRNGR